jgi:hypothetical protein
MESAESVVRQERISEIRGREEIAKSVAREEIREIRGRRKGSCEIRGPA